MSSNNARGGVRRPSLFRRAGVAVLAVAMIAIGLATAWGLWSVAGIYRELATSGRAAEAVMVGYREAGATLRSGPVVYFPMLEFRTADGRAIRTEAYGSIPPADYSRGGRIAIVHAVATPALAMPASALASWPPGHAWAIGAFSLFVTGFGVVLLWGEVASRRLRETAAGNGAR